MVGQKKKCCKMKNILDRINRRLNLAHTQEKNEPEDVTIQNETHKAKKLGEKINKAIYN